MGTEIIEIAQFLEQLPVEAVINRLDVDGDVITVLPEPGKDVVELFPVITAVCDFGKFLVDISVDLRAFPFGGDETDRLGFFLLDEDEEAVLEGNRPSL